MIFLVIDLVSRAFQLLMLLIVVRAVLSWIPSVDYWHPLIRAIVRVTDPILQPLRRVIPPLGGIDLTPLVALFLLELARALAVRLLAVVFGA
jgi:YggT family protein